MTNNPTSTDPIKTQAQGCGMALPWRIEVLENMGDIVRIRDRYGICTIDFMHLPLAVGIVRAVNNSALFERAMACLRSIKEHGYPWCVDIKELKAILKEHATGESEGL